MVVDLYLGRPLWHYFFRAVFRILVGIYVCNYSTLIYDWSTLQNFFLLDMNLYKNCSNKDILIFLKIGNSWKLSLYRKPIYFIYRFEKGRVCEKTSLSFPRARKKFDYCYYFVSSSIRLKLGLEFYYEWKSLRSLKRFLMAFLWHIIFRLLKFGFLARSILSQL